MMNVNEFIKLTERHPEEWIRYCEILITDTGMVVLARPSHQDAVIRTSGHTKKITNKLGVRYDPTSFLCDKYNIVCVWYGGYITPSSGLNKFQKRVIKKLVEHKLLIDLKLGQYNDYWTYKMHRKLGIVEEIDL